MPRSTRTEGPHPVDRHVGRRVCERRLGLGYNQSELAKALGLTFQQVQKYEKGANRISASKLWDIAAFLKVDIGYFFAGFAEAADGMAEEASTFDHGYPVTRSTIEIDRLTPRLPLARQKLALQVIEGMARSGEQDIADRDGEPDRDA